MRMQGRISSVTLELKDETSLKTVCALKKPLQSLLKAFISRLGFTQFPNSVTNNRGLFYFILFYCFQIRSLGLRWLSWENHSSTRYFPRVLSKDSAWLLEKTCFQAKNKQIPLHFCRNQGRESWNSGWVLPELLRDIKQRRVSWGDTNINHKMGHGKGNKLKG